MPALSAILIARNEEADLPRALQSLKGVADEIVLVDSGSTDRTVEIARAAGARVFERPFVSFAEIVRMTNYLGGWIRHSGWYPDKIVRLYDRCRGRFTGTIHESVRLDGFAGRLDGLLHHFNVRTYEEHRAKIDAFTTIAAGELYERGRRHWRAAMYFAAPWTFFQRLVLQLGFLDGRRGWVIAWTSAQYVRLKYRKLGALVRANAERRRAEREAKTG